MVSKSRCIALSSTDPIADHMRYKSCSVQFDPNSDEADAYVWPSELHFDGGVGGQAAANADNDENGYISLAGNVFEVDRVAAGGSGIVSYVHGTGAIDHWQLYALRLSKAMYGETVQDQLECTTDQLTKQSPPLMRGEAELCGSNFALIG